MVTPPVVLSGRLNDKDHGAPVVQGLKDLARVSNVTHQALLAMASRLANLPPVPTIAQIKQALQAAGAQPLNITQLVPVNTSTLTSVITVDTHANRLIVDTSTLTAGQFFLESDRYALYEWTDAGWVFLGNLLGPMGVTLSPDTKPGDLGTGDKTFTIYATDFDRTYIWTGSAWANGPGEPPQLLVSYFDTATPPTGWALCDGNTVTRSTAAGGTASYTTRDLISSGLIIRSAAAAGGTGGGSTATTSINGTNTTVQAGAGVDVAAKNHTHSVTIPLPPYMELVPMVRL